MLELLVNLCVHAFVFVLMRKGYVDNAEGKLNKFVAHAIVKNDINDSVWIHGKAVFVGKMVVCGILSVMTIIHVLESFTLFYPLFSFVSIIILLVPEALSWRNPFVNVEAANKQSSYAFLLISFMQASIYILYPPRKYNIVIRSFITRAVAAIVCTQGFDMVVVNITLLSGTWIYVFPNLWIRTCKTCVTFILALVLPFYVLQARGKMAHLLYPLLGKTKAKQKGAYFILPGGWLTISQVLSAAGTMLTFMIFIFSQPSTYQESSWWLVYALRAVGTGLFFIGLYVFKYFSLSKTSVFFDAGKPIELNEFVVCGAIVFALIEVGALYREAIEAYYSLMVYALACLGVMAIVFKVRKTHRLQLKLFAYVVQTWLLPKMAVFPQYWVMIVYSVGRVLLYFEEPNHLNSFVCLSLWSTGISLILCREGVSKSISIFIVSVCVCWFVRLGVWITTMQAMQMIGMENKTNSFLNHAVKQKFSSILFVLNRALPNVSGQIRDVLTDAYCECLRAHDLCHLFNLSRVASQRLAMRKKNVTVKEIVDELAHKFSAIKNFHVDFRPTFVVEGTFFIDLEVLVLYFSTLLPLDEIITTKNGEMKYFLNVETNLVEKTHAKSFEEVQICLKLRKVDQNSKVETEVPFLSRHLKWVAELLSWVENIYSIGFVRKGDSWVGIVLTLTFDPHVVKIKPISTIGLMPIKKASQVIQELPSGLSFAVLDDVKLVRDSTLMLLLERLQGNNKKSFALGATYAEAMLFVSKCNTECCDIAVVDYYLDYEDAELSGMHIAINLRKQGFKGLIFIHSANEGIDLDYSVIDGFIAKGFDARAIHFQITSAWNKRRSLESPPPF